MQRCVICERSYEATMARCPAYQGSICSLCCSLDARCNDLCKPEASLSAQWSRAMQYLLPRRAWPFIDSGLGHYLLLMAVVLPFRHCCWVFSIITSSGSFGDAAVALTPALKLSF